MHDWRDRPPPRRMIRSRLDALCVSIIILLGAAVAALYLMQRYQRLQLILLALIVLTQVVLVPGRRRALAREDASAPPRTP